MDIDACNYNPDATVDDGNCAVNLDICGTCGGTIVIIEDCCPQGQVSDCNGDCGGSAVEDCAGTCGGTAVIDNCEECGGDNSTCVNYSTEIQPIFNANCNCIVCHNGGHSTGLDLRSHTGVMGGSNSRLVIIKYDHLSSELWKKIDSAAMPPSGSLTTNQIYLIMTWIDEGALDN